MPFHRIEAEKLSGAVTRQIEQLILRGLLRPGDRLPAERDLAERLGVSRPSLREALADLQARGLLTARAGAGVFVADVLGAAFSPALIRLFSEHAEAVDDYLSFRRELEGMAAERAARDGADADLQVVDRVFARMQAARTANDAAAEAQLDAEFHLSILEAAHNVVMLHMMRAMFGLLRQGVFYNRRLLFEQSDTPTVLLDQHHAINAALQRRDPAGARAAVETHLDFVAAAITARRKADRHAEFARLRAESEASR